MIFLQISNYRCFDDAGVTLALEPGFTSFLGVNNSGKSALLRFFYEFRSVFAGLSKNTDALRTVLKGGDMPFSIPRMVVDSDEIFHNRNSGDIEITIDIKPDKRTPVTAQHANAAIIKFSRRTKNCKVQCFVGGKPIPPDVVKSDLHFDDDVLLRSSSQASGNFAYFFQAFDVLARAFYIPAFRHISAFNAPDPADGNANYFDLQIGQQFINYWDALQTGFRQADREKIQELVDELGEIFGFQGLQITASQNRHSLQLLVNRKSLHLQDLGSGLSQFILMLGNVAFKSPSLILIDEPELNLHPSYQIKLMRALGLYATHGVWFATHSLGLARTVSDRMFTVRQENAKTEVQPFARDPRIPELLGELNFEGFREIGFNKLLLVEGRTDIKTYSEFLRVLGVESKVFILSLGGAEFINGHSRDELAQVRSICPDMWAVIDSERGEGEDIPRERLAFAEICKDLKIPCQILDRRATENYLSESAVQKEHGPNMPALGPYQRRKDVANCWPKSDNWRIVRHMGREEVERTDLGAFLAQLR